MLNVNPFSSKKNLNLDKLQENIIEFVLFLLGFSYYLFSVCGVPIAGGQIQPKPLSRAVAAGQATRPVSCLAMAISCLA